MTFRQKIILFLVVAATFPVLFAGILSNRSYQREMVARIDESNLRSATLTASQINDFLSNAVRSLQLSMQLIPFEAFEIQERSHALKIPYRQFDFVNIVGLFDAEGVPLSEAAYESRPANLQGLEKHEPVTPDDVLEFAKHIPFKKVRFGTVAIGAPYFSMRTQTPRVALAASLSDSEDGRSWILAAEITLKDVLEKVQGIRPSVRGVAYIVDGEGRVICHTADELMAKRVSLSGLGIVAAGIEKKAPLTKRYNAEDGAEMAGAFGPISLGGWGLVVAQPIDEAFAPVKRMRDTTILWVVIGLLAAVMGGFVLSIGLAAPIKDLVRGAEKIAEGRFGDTIPVKSKGEIGQLAHSFNKMSGALKASFDTIYQQKEEIALWNEELQARVNERTRELREAEEQIIRSEKMAAVAELSAGMAHEINNPLTAILGFSQLMLLQTEPDHKFNRYLDAIVTGSKRIRTIVDDMLRFSRKRGNANHTDVELNQILESTVQMASRQLAERSIKILMSLSDVLPKVHGDSADLQQVFIHLVNNAKNAMPSGGELQISSKAVDGGAVKITVIDTGVGILPENLSKVFNPFYTTKDEWGKTGVGLSVVDRIVREHGGKISVTSKVGQGSTFSVYLPGVPRSTHLG